MHTSPATQPAQAPTYRERLAPSLWVIVSAGVVAPMASLVFVRMDRTLALVIGVVVAVLVVAALIGLAPRLSLTGSTLRAGRAHIDVSLLGEPEALTGDEAKDARGSKLDVHGWHLIRGGIDGIVRVPVIDADDPATSWTISTRTPDRLAALVAHAQRRAVRG